MKYERNNEVIICLMQKLLLAVQNLKEIEMK